MTSPEHGAQHECNNTRLWPLGGISFWRVLRFSIIYKNVATEVLQSSEAFGGLIVYR